VLIESEQELYERLGIAKIKRIHLEISEGCNISCPMCTFHDGLGKYTWTEIGDEADLGAIGARFGGVHIGDRSEPLINPRWDKIVSVLTAGGAKVSLQTNAKMIKSLAYARRVVRSGVHLISISIDGVSNDTVSRIRSGINFDEIDTAIRYLNQAKAELKSETPYLFANCVAMRSNLNEIPPLVDYLVNNQFVRVRIGYLSLRCPDSNLVSELLIYDLPGVRHMVDEVRRRAVAAVQDISLDLSIFQEGVGLDRRDNCTVYRDNLYVRHDGETFFCYGKQHIGNLYRDGIDSCLHSPGYQDYMERVSQPGNDICSNCTYCKVMALDRVEDHFGRSAIEHYSRNVIDESILWAAQRNSPEDFWANYYTTTERVGTGI